MDKKSLHNSMNQCATDEFLTIVIVSDDYEKIVHCNNSLDQSGEYNYCVVAALTTKQGLALTQAHHPNCIAIDTVLIDDKLLNTLSERFKNTPVIFITNESNTKLIDKLSTKGFTHSIAAQNIDNDGLHNAIQFAIKDTPNTKPRTDDIYNNQRKIVHYNSYSYAESKQLSANNQPKNNAHETIELANILMVEDNIYDIKLTQIRLNEDDKLQFNLFTANNGKEALEFLRDDKRPRIDLILLDINMPVMNGFEFLEEHQKEQDSADIPIIICSTSSYGPDKDKAAKLGADGYITKPASLEKICVPLAKFDHIKIKNHGKKRYLQYVKKTGKTNRP